MLLLWLLLWLSKCRGRLLRSLLLLRLIRHLLCRHLLLLLRLRRRQLRKRRVLLRHLSIYLFRQRCVLLIHSKGMELTRLDSTVYKANSNQDGSRWNGKTKESCLRDRVLSWARCSFPVEFKLSRTPRYLATLVPDPRVRGGGKVDGRAVPTMKTAVLHGCLSVSCMLALRHFGGQQKSTSERSSNQEETSRAVSCELSKAWPARAMAQTAKPL